MSSLPPPPPLLDEQAERRSASRTPPEGPLPAVELLADDELDALRGTVEAEMVFRQLMAGLEETADAARINGE